MPESKLCDKQKDEAGLLFAAEPVDAAFAVFISAFPRLPARPQSSVLSTCAVSCARFDCMLDYTKSWYNFALSAAAGLCALVDGNCIEPLRAAMLV